MSKPLRIGIDLRYPFTIRDFLFTPVWDEMVKRTEVQFCILSRRPEVIHALTERQAPNVQLINEKPQPLRGKQVSLPERLRRRWRMRFDEWDDDYLFDSVGYRYAAINNLSHYHIRKNSTPEAQERLKVFREYRRGESAGWPCAKSKLLYRFLYWARHSWPNVLKPEDVAHIAKLDLDLFVFARMHHVDTAYTGRILRRLGIPMIGYVASWDHPSTKGPTTRGFRGYIVASQRMVDEMVELHGIAPEAVNLAGKVQMDAFTHEEDIPSREQLFEMLGIPPHHRLVTFGPNTTGIKEHEVSIARNLAEQFKAGTFGDATLLIRSHPADKDWERDFKVLEDPPRVRCINAASFGFRQHDQGQNSRDDLLLLASLMKHSDVVMQSRGSLALDAIAFNTPVVSIGYDGELEVPPCDSVLQLYHYEHYKPLVAADGTWVVGSDEALYRAIRGYLTDPSIHAAGRQRIREENIEPFDGRAGKRLVDYMVACAEQARGGTLRTADWGYNGLGDLRWASRQRCDVEEFVDS